MLLSVVQEASRIGKSFHVPIILRHRRAQRHRSREADCTLETIVYVVTDSYGLTRTSTQGTSTLQ